MTRYSKTMSEALEEVREASARADAKRAMSKDKDMKQNPFSKDDDATDDDVKAASKNIIMQLRKSVSMKGNHAVEFSDGKKKIDPKFAQAAMDKFMRIRRPDDKLKFQNKLAKSYKDLLKALKEQYEMVEEVELDEKYDLYHKSFSDAMSHAYDYAKKKLGITVDPKEIDNKVATGPKKPSDGKTNTYRLKGKGGNLQIQVYNKGGSKPFELNMYKEEVELDEGVPYKFAAVDKKGLVIGFASNERDAKDMAKRNKGRVVTLTKPLPDNKKSDMMINRPFPDKMDKFPTNTSATQGKRMGEEDEKKPDNRPDSAKEVEQGRDDKKKTRIAQLQLQIAKATETINKLNTQEKQ
jgi:hypothetical protein